MPETIPDPGDLEKLSSELEEQSPEEILKVAYDRFGDDIGMATAFGAEGMVLLDMISRIRPNAKVFYVDTQLFFQPTYDLIERARERYPFEWIRILPELTPDQQSEKHGAKLYDRDPNACCRMRKIEPLQRFFAESGLKAWIASVRRDQAPTRANTPVVLLDPVFHQVKFNPLVRWTWDQVWDYIRRHSVLYNTLHDWNYPSIGCWPCTKPVQPGDDGREGRWSGRDKTECGINAAPEEDR